MREFEYKAPRSLREAVSLLAKAKGEARILAGGTDLIAQMKEGRRSPSVVIDGKSIPELKRLEFNERRGLRVGAAVSLTEVANFPEVEERYPIIEQVSRLVGSVQIQNRATVGGNFCNGAPSADTAPAFIVLGAKCVIAGPRGKREVLAEEFFQGPGRTVLATDELLVEISVPPPAKNSAAYYLRFTPREEMDIAVAGVASYLRMTPSGRRCQEARISLAAVAPTPVRAKDAEAALIGKAITQKAIQEAGEKAVLAAKPINDVRGSIEYRKELVEVLTRRTLRECARTLGVKL